MERLLDVLCLLDFWKILLKGLLNRVFSCNNFLNTTSKSMTIVSLIDIMMAQPCLVPACPHTMLSNVTRGVFRSISVFLVKKMNVIKEEGHKAMGVGQ